MLANFFSKSTPVKVLYLIILLAIFYCLSIFMVVPIEKTIMFWLSKVGVFLALTFYVFVGSFIIRKNTLTLDNLYALLLVVLLLGSFQQTFFNSNYLLANVLLLFAFRKIYSLKSGIKTKLKLFDAAIWIGVAALVYEWSALFIMLVYIGMIVYQRVSFKNLVVPIIGFVTPIFLFFTFHFYFNSTSVFIHYFEFNWNVNFVKYNSLKILIPLTFLTTILFWAVVLVTPKIIIISNKLKKSWYILLTHLILAVIIVTISPIKNGSEMIFLLFPGTIIIANYLPKSKSENFKNLILYLFIGIAISVYFL